MTSQPETNRLGHRYGRSVSGPEPPPPRHADGQPLRPGLVAVVDETRPQIQGGQHYVLTASVLLDADEVIERLRVIFAGRTRQFHWHKEGVQKKTAMVTLIEELGVVAHARYQITAPKRQTQARNELLAAIALDVHHDGAAHLVIEGSDRATEGRDRHVLLNTFEGVGGVPFGYDHRTKNEQILWIADAVCGAIKDHLTGDDPQWFNRLQSSGVISQLTYGANQP